MWKLKLMLAVLALSVAALLAQAVDATTTTTSTTTRSVGWVSRSRPKECAKGSSVWCKDLRWAKKCGAVKYCIQVVWEKMKLDPDPSNICDTCKEMVKEARDVLESNSTQELLAEVLEGTCQIYFPIKVLSRECIKYVDEFIPELVAMLSSRMDPQAVCSIAWLCNSNKLQELIGDVRLVENKIKPKIRTGDACQDCKAFMADVVAKVQAMGKGQLEQQLNNGCKVLKGFASTICEKAVDEHIDEIYNDIVNMKPDQTCKMAAMCIDGVDKVFKNAPPIQVQLVKVDSGDTECDFCVQLVTRLKETITANSSKEEIKQTLLSICTQLKSYSDKCVAYVNDYFEEIYEFLVDEMNPPVICKALGLCKQQPLFLPGIKEITADTPMHLTGADESNSVNWKQPEKSVTRKMDVRVQDVVIKVPVSKQQQPSNQRKNAPKNCDVSAGGPSCAICEYALHQIQQILTENATKDQIKEAIDKVCELLPATLSDQCTKFVDQYGDAILAMLAQEMDPSIVCTELGLCTSEKIEVLTNVAPSMPLSGGRIKKPHRPGSSPPFTVKKSSTCLLCQFLAAQLEKMLSKNSTKEEIKVAVEKVCSLMPKSVESECDQFVENYADIIVDILVQTLDSNILCSALGVCSAATTNGAVPSIALSATAQRQLPLGRMFPGTVHMQLQGKESCLYCQYAMQLVHTILNSNGTMDELILGLDNLCHQLPRDYTDRCDSLVEQYAGLALDTLRTMDLTQFCRLLSFCQGSVADTLREHANTAAAAAVQHANSDNCPICEATVEIVDKLLTDPNVNNEIVHATKQVCSYLPVQTRPKCQSIIDVYGPYVFQTIGELADPKQVCQVIQLCAPQSGHTKNKLLGGEKCTYGPAYWCKSKVHAKACGAEKHCKDFVWKN